jgi:hypothetical protein
MAARRFVFVTLLSFRAAQYLILAGAIAATVTT